MEDKKFEVTNSKGQKTIYEVIATYHDDNTNKDYIVYTDRSFDSNNKLNVFYSLYKLVNNNIKLIDVVEIDDKKICLELIKELVNNINPN